MAPLTRVHLKAKHAVSVGTIRRDARRQYELSGREMRCAVCSYDRHVEVAHVIAIAAFRGRDLVVNINTLSNLVALCPNHHWEHDNKMLDEDALRAVTEETERFP